MNIGSIIKERRIELKLSQQEIADYCNVTSSTVCQWEKGNIQNMRRDKIILLATVLQINPLDIIKGELRENKKAEELYKIVTELNKEGIEKIIAYANDLKESGKYGK